MKRGTKMKTFKVITSWTGYSEITVQAKNKEQAEQIAFEGNYDRNNEVYSTDDIGVEIFGMKKEDEQLLNIRENQDANI